MVNPNNRECLLFTLHGHSNSVLMRRDIVKAVKHRNKSVVDTIRLVLFQLVHFGQSLSRGCLSGRSWRFLDLFCRFQKISDLEILLSYVIIHRYLVTG